MAPRCRVCLPGFRRGEGITLAGADFLDRRPSALAAFPIRSRCRRSATVGRSATRTTPWSRQARSRTPGRRTRRCRSTGRSPSRAAYSRIRCRHHNRRNRLIAPRPHSTTILRKRTRRHKLIRRRNRPTDNRRQLRRNTDSPNTARRNPERRFQYGARAFRNRLRRTSTAPALLLIHRIILRGHPPTRFRRSAPRAIPCSPRLDPWSSSQRQRWPARSSRRSISGSITQYSPRPSAGFASPSSRSNKSPLIPAAV
jgi:hypothetical protein